MNLWFALALGAGLADSWAKASQKWVVSFFGSKPLIMFCGNLIASIILFSVSYFVVGFPELKSGFWTAVFITGALNSLTFPILLRAYEIGEFSSVYSMILLTPVFLFLTSFLFLGEIASVAGIFGVLLTIIGLYIIGQNHGAVDGGVTNFARGNLLGVLVALIWSVSVNFDKLSARYSDPFFAPAVIVSIMSLASGVYLLLNYFFFRSREAEADAEGMRQDGKLSVFSYLSLFLVGATLAFSNVLHNSALLYGSASYTIAIKRTGVLWGVIWGWLFFRENNISRKFLGAAIAVAGVAAILFA